MYLFIYFLFIYCKLLVVTLDVLLICWLCGLSGRLLACSFLIFYYSTLFVIYTWYKLWTANELLVDTAVVPSEQFCVDLLVTNRKVCIPSL